MGIALPLSALDVGRERVDLEIPRRMLVLRLKPDNTGPWRVRNNKALVAGGRSTPTRQSGPLCGKARGAVWQFQLLR